ncbi:YHS domain-containing protein [Promicromonospora vindobonensis]|uniref:YHS domain-containing protein n=1 Tax=Promicromonospora vindobonensis TaxID=195748 RepID=A0ABW5VV05_9MICO
MGNDHDHGQHQPGGQADGGHCGGHGPSAATSHPGGNLLGPTADELAECPVMRGSTVIKTEAEAKGLFRDYEGQRYWFCCAGCEAPFDADPARYAAAV